MARCNAACVDDARPQVRVSRTAWPGQGKLQNAREMGICASCAAMLAESDPACRHGYVILVAVCIEKAPIGRRCVRMRCLECGKEWLKTEPIKGTWGVSWVEG